MSLSRRRFTQEFPVERLPGASAAEVSRAFEIPNLLHRWQGPGNAFPGEGKRRWEETPTAELERSGRQTMEIDFLKGCGLVPSWKAADQPPDLSRRSRR